MLVRWFDEIQLVIISVHHYTKTKYIAYIQKALSQNTVDTISERTQWKLVRLCVCILCTILKLSLQLMRLLHLFLAYVRVKCADFGKSTRVTNQIYILNLIFRLTYFVSSRVARPQYHSLSFVELTFTSWLCSRIRFLVWWKSRAYIIILILKMFVCYNSA